MHAILLMQGMGKLICFKDIQNVSYHKIQYNIWFRAVFEIPSHYCHGEMIVPTEDPWSAKLNIIFIIGNKDARMIKRRESGVFFRKRDFYEMEGTGIPSAINIS